MLAALVFDLGEQQARVVVTITQLAAVRVDAAADQMQVVGVFVAGDAAQFVALGGDFAVGVVGESTRGAAGQSGLCQAVGCVPLVMGDGAGFFLTGDLPTQGVVTVFTLATIGQALFQQLAKAVPAQRVTTAVGVSIKSGTAKGVLIIKILHPL